MATGKIIISFYDGTRQLVPPGTRALLTVTDGNKRTVFRDFVQGPTVTLDVPFFDNFGDDYTVLASPDKGLDAGFFPATVLTDRRLASLPDVSAQGEGLTVQFCVVEGPAAAFAAPR
jgi:hypothetical protein